MLRLAMRLPLAAALFLCLASAAFAQEDRRPELVIQGVKPSLLLQRPPVDLFRQFLERKRVSADAITKDLESFRKLPEDVQALVVVAATPEASPSSGIVRLDDRKHWAKIDPSKLEILVTPSISAFVPTDASRDEVALVSGTNLRGTSQVYFNGAPATTYHWTFWGATSSSLLAFRVPTGVNYGASYPVQVRNGTLASNTVSFPVVAPRSYRGYHGWKFANRGGPTVPWAIYRNYFGAAAVEFGDGTHRPSAQTWYDTVYKGAGGGGNCYGMSLMSLRIKQWNIGGLLHQAWWNTHRLGSVWEYDSNRTDDQVWQSIQEMQASQYAEPQHTLLWDRIANQGANAAWLSAQTMTGQAAPHGCVIGVTGGGGHAVNVYRTGPDAVQRAFIVYDNNNPYEATETDGPDPNQPVTNRTANTFSYGGYIHIGAYDLPELLVTPSLPAAAIGAGMGLAAESSYLVVEPGARVTQITDEAGNTFFAGLQENQGPNRIPGAVRTIPLASSVGPRADGSPGTWLFMRSVGKSYRVDLLSPDPKSGVYFVQKGLVAEIRAEGLPFSVTAANVGRDDARIVLENPSDVRRGTLRLISLPNANEERSFEIRDLNPNLNRPLEIGLNQARDALRITNRSAAPFAGQVVLRRDAANQHVATRILALDVPAAQIGVLRPQNWGDLGRRDLQLELQSLAGARLNIRPLRP